MPTVLHSELRIVPGLMAERKDSWIRPMVDWWTLRLGSCPEWEEASEIDDVCMCKIVRSCLRLGVGYSCSGGSRES